MTSRLWIGAACFLLGALSTIFVVSRTPSDTQTVVIPETPTATPPLPGESVSAAPAPRECSGVDLRAVTADIRTPPSEDDGVAYLRHQGLHVPLGNLKAGDLRSSFDEKREASRAHEAMDILAPRNTAVLAVDDGCVAKLFESKAGGLTVYQFDPTLTYTYYYAHLERYADDLDQGDAVRKGAVIGYVGTSGNAPPDTPHLHFAIFIMGIEKKWWEGTPIDPYDVWRNTPSLPLR